MRGDGARQVGGVLGIVGADEDLLHAQLVEERGMQHRAAGRDQHVAGLEPLREHFVGAVQRTVARAVLLIEHRERPPATFARDPERVDLDAEFAHPGDVGLFFGDALLPVGRIDLQVAQRARHRASLRISPIQLPRR